MPNIRNPSPQDEAAVQRLMAEARNRPPGALFPESVDEAFKDTIAAIRFDDQADERRGACCILQHYSIGISMPNLPFTSGATYRKPVWCTQVSDLLPEREGLMTDGTHPRLLVATLEAMMAEHPETADRPVWASLADVGAQPTTVEKWQLFFSANVTRYDPPRERAAIWLDTLAEAVEIGRRKL